MLTEPCEDDDEGDDGFPEPPENRIPDDLFGRRNDPEVERLLLALWLARTAATLYTSSLNDTTCHSLGHVKNCSCDQLRHDTRGLIWFLDQATAALEGNLYGYNDVADKLYDWLVFLSGVDLDTNAGHAAPALSAFTTANNPLEN
jgi:hypothetical protein